MVDFCNANDDVFDIRGLEELLDVFLDDPAKLKSTLCSRWRTSRRRTARSSCLRSFSYVGDGIRTLPLSARALTAIFHPDFQVSIVTLFLVPYTAYVIFGGESSVR